MAKYDWNTFRNCVAFLAVGVAPGTRRPHHDSELISCYHYAFLTWGHYHNNIVLFYHDSPITRSHFMDPTDRAIKGFYCISIANALYILQYCTKPLMSWYCIQYTITKLEHVPDFINLRWTTCISLSWLSYGLFVTSMVKNDPIVIKFDCIWSLSSLHSKRSVLLSSIGKTKQLHKNCLHQNTRELLYKQWLAKSAMSLGHG